MGIETGWVPISMAIKFLVLKLRLKRMDRGTLKRFVWRMGRIKNDIGEHYSRLISVDERWGELSLVPRPIPAFQCYTLKNGRA